MEGDILLDAYTRFQANDEIILLTAISITELTGKKLKLYSGLAESNEVKNFFNKRASVMQKVCDDLRKNLDRIGRE